MKIIVDKHIPFLEGIIENYGIVEYISGANFTPDKVKDADILVVRTVTQINKKLLQGSRVKLICSATIGTDHIDTTYCEAEGISWENAPGCNAGAVKQYIASSLILLSRKHSFELEDVVIGIVGVGNVGKLVAEVCIAFGMTVLLNDPPRARVEGKEGFVDLETIKRQANIITFHTPLVKEGEYKTFHLGNQIFFKSLERKPFIINTCRGSVIETNELMYAIETKQIQGAVIDCWENEPMIKLDLLSKIDFGTSHIAGYSSEGKANAARAVLKKIAKFVNEDVLLVERIREEAPQNPIIDLDKYGSSTNRIHEAILATYNPLIDFDLLNQNPLSFKELRNNYNYRREFGAYIIINANHTEQKILTDLGFICH